MSGALRTTPLHEEHVRLGARMIPFAGYTMPVQYRSGIQAEHRVVRRSAGLFDVSHMGEVWIEGPEALALVQHVTVNDASILEPGRAQYSALCREDGGVLDDLIVYRVPEGGFLLVENAVNRKRDVQWIREHQRRFDATVEDRSDETALVALQGPRAEEILAPFVDTDLRALGPSRVARAKVSGVTALVARTGYTGEDGFEIFLGPEDVVTVWRLLLASGERDGLRPVGLGARDTLRLEVGYLLYGNDLDEEHTALESGLGWIVKLDKGAFVGREALAREKELGTTRKLTGIVLEDTGFPRAGCPVVSEGEEVGVVTSGTMSPCLEAGIAMAYVPVELSAPDTPLWVRIRGRDVRGSVRPRPFYTRGSRRK